jgi:hypothetical protein
MADYLARIWEQDPTLETPFSKCMPGAHICYTNAKRKEINKALNTTGTLIKYEGTPNQYNEDIRLAVGTKLLALSTSDTLGITKSEVYVVTEIDEDSFKIGDIIVKNMFVHNWFCLGYAITIHKAQGMTINGTLNIHELFLIKPNRKLFYTAVSRATSLDNIRLVRAGKTIR